jgi:hypothetical protein
MTPRCKRRGMARAADEMYDLLGNNLEEARDLRQSIVTLTGLPRLDEALGGGLFCGVTELYGQESTGKTLLMGHILAAAQNRQKRVGLVATEHLDLPYLRNIGVLLDELAIIRGSNPKELIDAVLEFAQGEDTVTGVDSLSAIQGHEGDYYDWQEAADYLLTHSSSMPATSCIVVTSQVRQRKSAVPGKLYGRGTSSASRSVESGFVTRLELSRREVSENEYTMDVLVRRHLAAAPGKVIDFPVTKGQPIDVGIDLLMLGIENGTVHQRGAFYYIGDTVLGCGRDVAGGVIWTCQELTNKVLGVRHEL